MIFQKEPDRQNLGTFNAKSLWYPLAHIPDFKMPTKGKYKNNYPIGAVIHFTAGRSKGGLMTAVNTAKYGKECGYSYFTIADNGDVVQAFPLDSWGYHCGKSFWPGLGEGLSSRLVGIEVCCAGRLEKAKEGFKSWFGEIYSADEVRHHPGFDNVQQGYYHRFTLKQEESLKNLILWLKKNNPDVFKLEYVLGHDSISPGRKNDPGGSLSMSIPAYQTWLKTLYNSEK